MVRNVTYSSRPTRLLAIALICGWSVFHSVSGAAGGEKAASHTVMIEGVAYQPASLVVRRGDTVVWVNKDPFPHTVTARGVFDSRDIPAGASWKYVARKSGSYTYICTLHPNMVGTLDVQ